MTRKGNALIITLILVAVAVVGAYGAFRLLHHYSGPAANSSADMTAGSTLVQPTSAPSASGVPTTGPSNTNLDAQINSIQDNVVKLDQDQAAYTQINQSADTNYTLP